MRVRHGFTRTASWLLAASFWIVALITPRPVCAQTALLGAGAGATGEPLWEAGVLAAIGSVAHYPASSQHQRRALPLPYIIYRGETLRLGDKGIARARTTFMDGRLELDVGFDGSFDVESDKNRARRGMPDLDFLVEAGPEITWHFRPASDPLQIDLSLETRAVISAKLFAFAYQGISVNPELSIFDRSFSGSNWMLYAAVGPLFGYDGVNAYFYEVKPTFATQERPAYEAQSGYIGSKLTLGAGYPFSPRLLGFAAAQISLHDGSANERSPLYRSHVNVNLGIGLRWSFWQSGQRVGAP
jgi:MipA family protein